MVVMKGFEDVVADDDLESSSRRCRRRERTDRLNDNGIDRQFVRQFVSRRQIKTLASRKTVRVEHCMADFYKSAGEVKFGIEVLCPDQSESVSGVRV